MFGTLLRLYVMIPLNTVLYSREQKKLTQVFRKNLPRWFKSKPCLGRVKK